MIISYDLFVIFFCLLFFNSLSLIEKRTNGIRLSKHNDRKHSTSHEKSSQKPPFEFSTSDMMREKEWDKRVSQYDTIFTGEHEAWYNDNKVVLNPKRSGVRGASAIIDDTHRLIMCTIPKIGSSTWRKFMLYLAFPSIDEVHGKKYYFETYGVKRPDFHNISKNGLKLMAVQHPATALEYYNDPSLLKVFHARNPMTRLLSAWLSKNAESKDPKPFAMHFATFGDFVQVQYDKLFSCVYQSIIYLPLEFGEVQRRFRQSRWTHSIPAYFL